MSLGDDLPNYQTPYATLTVIGLASVLCLAEHVLAPRLLPALEAGFGAVPAILSGSTGFPSGIAHPGPAAATLLTSFLMQPAPLRLLRDLLLLGMCGNNIEDALGSRLFPVFLLAVGSLAELAVTLAFPLYALPLQGLGFGVSGVVGAYLLLFPQARITVFTLSPLWELEKDVGMGLITAFWLGSNALDALDDGLYALKVSMTGHVAALLLGAAAAFVLHRMGVATLYDEPEGVE